MRLIIVSGMSGSGKSVALHLLEDIGYYCVDNLPLQFLPDVAVHLDRAGYHDLAVSVDARSEAALGDLPTLVAGLRGTGYDVKLLFLTASNTALTQRYSESRRSHPLAQRLRKLRADRAEPTLAESIAAEREILAPLMSIAHTIDTGELHPNTLRQWIREFVDSPRVNLTLAFDPVQGWPAVRCRPRVRRAQSAQPVLRQGTATADGSRSAGDRFPASAAVGHGHGR
jgi:UPF0042 nucleotide-binding protein